MALFLPAFIFSHIASITNVSFFLFLRPKTLKQFRNKAIFLISLYVKPKSHVKMNAGGSSQGCLCTNQKGYATYDYQPVLSADPNIATSPLWPDKNIGLAGCDCFTQTTFPSAVTKVRKSSSIAPMH